MICMEYTHKYVPHSYVIRRHLVHKYRVICVATGCRNTNPQSSDRPVADLRLHRQATGIDPRMIFSPLINNVITFFF
jgi:hypothetical protein